MEKKRVAIIGGGVTGCSIAYHLSLYEGIETTVFEKSQIGSGTTAKSAGTLCLLDDSLPEAFFDLRVLCLKTYKEMNEGLKNLIGFQKSGTLVVSPTEEHLERARRHVELSRKHGFSAEFIDDPNDLKRYLPDVNTENVAGGAWTLDDGYADATAIAVAFANKARDRGVKILTETKVPRILRTGERVTRVETTKGTFDFDIIVNAGGPWANEIGRMANLELPLVHTKAEVFILKPSSPLDYRFPILKYPTWYARAEGDNIFTCRSHMAMDLDNPMHAGIWDPDALPPTGGTEDYFWEFILEQLNENVPKLADSFVVKDWVGYRSVTRDKLPIVGESTVPGFLLAVGPSGNGVILAPTIGPILAKYIATGKKDPLLEKFRLDRFG